MINMQESNGPKKFKKISVPALALLLLLSGCGTLQPVPFSTAEKQAEVTETKQVIFNDQQPVTGPVDLYEAMARAVKYNLSYRLKMMDSAIASGQFGISKFSLLPKLTASAGYDHRNNINASVSESVATGRESLEASTSRDRDFTTANMSLSWNILDFGVSYFQAKQQADKYLIATERRRKALHNLIRDVRYAYWRAVAVQQLQNDITKVMADSEKAMAYSRTVEKEQLKPLLEILQYQKTLLEVTRQLETLQQELALAKIELAQLMNLPSGTNFELSVPDLDDLHVPKIKYDLNKLEELALLNRPELMEAGYQKRISSNETKKSIARLFPGITFRVSDQYDSNSFTINNSWIESGMQIAWNLVNLVSGPEYVKASKMKEEATNLQQMTLSMAVLSQVNIAFRQYVGFIGQYKRNSDLEDINRRILGQMKTTRLATTQSQVEEIKAATNAIMSKLQRYQTYAHMQNAFGRVYTAAGIDPLPVTTDDQDISQLTAAFKSTMVSWDIQPAKSISPKKRSQHKIDKTSKLSTLPASVTPKKPKKSSSLVKATVKPPISPIPGRYPAGSLNLLKYDVLKGMSKKEIRILRNEIYARNSYRFQTLDMKNHFRKENWYSAKYNDVSQKLSYIEKRNIDFIRSYEQSQ